MEPLIQFLLELLIQIVFEVLAEYGWRRIGTTPRQSTPWLAGLGCALLGAAAGGVSLLLFPALFLESRGARVANLVITPVAAGLAMGALGAWRRGRGQPLLRIDRFGYGYLFALAMAGVRFAFAR